MPVPRRASTCDAWGQIRQRPVAKGNECISDGHATKKQVEVTYIHHELHLTPASFNTVRVFDERL